jgi:SAM-dependent methyltransferase
MCPGCGSLERHRSIWSFVAKQLPPPGARPIRLLHIAPEWQLGKRLKRHPLIDYVSADLNSPDAMLRLDVTRMDLPDQSFDAIICSHVLEHVDDDGAAIAELFRVLRQDGWAVLETPVDWQRATTFEDWSIADPAGRLAAFGQWDHVRIYGRDFPDRLSSAGWAVHLEFPNEAGDLSQPGQLVHCIKPGRLG